LKPFKKKKERSNLTICLKAIVELELTVLITPGHRQFNSLQQQPAAAAAEAYKKFKKKGN